jgi:predicted ATPase
VGLRIYPDSFVGRGEDVARVIERLERARVLSVTGAAGMGKTRLVHEVARALSRRLYFVDAQGCGDEAALVAALLHVVGLRVDGLARDEALRRLSQALALERDALLVIDGAESLSTGARGALEHMAGALRDGQTIVTSRAPLGIRGEHLHRLSGLRDADAIELLRVRAIQRGAVLDDDDPALAEIVRRLDGIPLAIELMAPRVALVGAAQTSARLGDSQPPPGVDGTLVAALERSWRQLGASAREALVSLAVFPASFDLEAADFVAGSAAFEIEALYSAGLLERVEPARFRMLHVVRDLARARAGEEARTTAEQLHARHFAERARRALCRLATEGFPRELPLDAASYAAALERARDAGSIEAVAAIFAVTEPLRYATCATDEGRAALDEMVSYLEREHASLDAVLAVRIEAAEAARRAGDLEGATARARAAEQTLAASSGSWPRIEAAIDRAIGALAFVAGDTSTARERLERARDLARASDDRRLLAIVLGDLGSLALIAGRPLDASLLYARSARGARRLGATWVEAAACANLGVAAVELGDLVRARAAFADALEADAAYARSIVGAFAIGNLGLVAHLEGDERAASDAYGRALELSRLLGHEGFEGVYAGYLALAERGRVGDVATLAALEDAIALLERAGNRRERALFLAAESVISAALGRDGAASLRAARALIDEHDGATSAAVDVLAGSAPREVGALEVRLARRVLEAASGASPLADRVWSIASDGSWFAAAEGAERVAVASETGRRILEALLRARTERPGRTVAHDRLITLAWPGERMSPRAGRNRLKVGVSKLRAQGLRELIQTGPGGYYLATSQDVRPLAPDPSSAIYP